MGRGGGGGGQMVSVLAFFSDDPNSNPAEAYKLAVKDENKPPQPLNRFLVF